jgi:hypothetical protein
MTWRQSSIQLKDRKAHILMDDRFASSPPTQELPCLNWFGIWLIGPTPSDRYVPDQEEQAFAGFERKLIDLAGSHANGCAVYCIRLFSHGIVEFYMYTRDASTLIGVAPDFERHFPQYRIEHDTKSDPDWSEYKKYLAAIT